MLLVQFMARIRRDQFNYPIFQILNKRYQLLTRLGQRIFNLRWDLYIYLAIHELIILQLKNIEFYKLAHGQYPESLQQLLEDDKLAPIYDAAQGMNIKENSYYNYQKTGNRYLLFSSGQDGIPNTKDDLFPQITITDSSKIGLIKHR